MDPRPANRRGTFVIARVLGPNEKGVEQFQFNETPYTHQTELGAENEVRRLARLHEAEFAVFEQLYTAAPKLVEIEHVADRIRDQLETRTDDSGQEDEPSHTG